MLSLKTTVLFLGLFLVSRLVASEVEDLSLDPSVLESFLDGFQYCFISLLSIENQHHELSTVENFQVPVARWNLEFKNSSTHFTINPKLRVRNNCIIIAVADRSPGPSTPDISTIASFIGKYFKKPQGKVFWNTAYTNYWENVSYNGNTYVLIFTSKSKSKSYEPLVEPYFPISVIYQSGIYDWRIKVMVKHLEEMDTQLPLYNLSLEILEEQQELALSFGNNSNYLQIWGFTHPEMIETKYPHLINVPTNLTDFMSSKNFEMTLIQYAVNFLRLTPYNIISLKYDRMDPIKYHNLFNTFITETLHKNVKEVPEFSPVLAIPENLYFHQLPSFQYGGFLNSRPEMNLAISPYLIHPPYNRYSSYVLLFCDKNAARYFSFHAYTSPFKFDLWITLLICLVIVVLFIYILFRFYKVGDSSVSGSPIWIIYTIFFEQGFNFSSKLQKIYAFTYFYAMLVLICQILTEGYKSSVITNLLSPLARHHEIQWFEDAVNNNFTFLIDLEQSNYINPHPIYEEKCKKGVMDYCHLHAIRASSFGKLVQFFYVSFPPGTTKLPTRFIYFRKIFNKLRILPKSITFEDSKRINFNPEVLEDEFQKCKDRVAYLVPAKDADLKILKMGIHSSDKITIYKSLDFMELGAPSWMIIKPSIYNGISVLMNKKLGSLASSGIWNYWFDLSKWRLTRLKSLKNLNNKESSVDENIEMEDGTSSSVHKSNLPTIFFISAALFGISTITFFKEVYEVELMFWKFKVRKLFLKNF